MNAAREDELHLDDIKALGIKSTMKSVALGRHDCLNRH